MYLKNYEEQHGNIRSEVGWLDSLVNKNIEENAAEIALHISRLAGILNIHLNSEDKYLYPQLAKSDDEYIRKTAAAYQQEMGGLLEAFVKFKEKYNTKMKLMDNKATFAADYKTIVNALAGRMKKEESEIYKFIA